MKTVKPLRRRLVFFAVLISLFAVFGAVSLPAEKSPSFDIWITSDIEGYLVGCDCPSGTSAGLSAVSAALGKMRGDGDFLLDAGGFREPMRSDPLLESFMDEAADYLGYSAMAAVSSDLRDGRRVFNRRSKALPVSVAAAAEDSGFPGKLTGEDSALILHRGERTAALVQWAAAAEDDLISSEPGNSFRTRSPGEVLGILKEANADFRVLAVRGSLEDWDIFQRGIPGADSLIQNVPDLIIFTGPDSPSSLLPSGGNTGELTLPGTDGKTVPWLSLAPRGNGFARVSSVSGGNADIKIISLERGISPEDDRILAMGDSYMEALIASVSSGNSRGKTGRKAAVSASAGGEPDFKPVYWYPYGCKSCENFLWNTVPDLERRTGRILQITEKDTGSPEDFEELLKLMEEKGLELESIPVMLIADTLLQGDDEIKSGLERIMRGSSPINGRVDGSGKLSVRWEPGAIFLAGLLDGVNPCAFSAMVFLVSALAMAGRSKKTMLAIGMFYAFGIFITYSLIGAGLLGGLRRIAVTSGLRNILEWVLAGFLLLLSLLSVIDAVKISRGRSDLILKLPDKLSKRAHKLIREEVRSGAAAGGAFLLGAVVALIELGCTGQVYLPTIAWMISRGDGALPWLWLLLYNSAFIIPLFIVFALSYRGVSAVKLAAVFRKRGASVKFFTAGLLALLAFVLIIT